MKFNETKKEKTIEENWAVSVDSLFFGSTGEEGNKEFTLPKVPVIAGKMIIEFHSEGISPEEFATRNANYERLGYRTAWVFNLAKEVKSREIIPDNVYNSTQRMLWTSPYECLNGSLLPQDTDKNYAVYFVMEEPGISMEMHRVIWSSKTGGKADFRSIMLSPIGISFQDIKNPEVFFYSKKDWMNKELKRHPVAEIKKIGAAGYAEKAYICGKTGSRGLTIPGKKGCESCKYCAATERLADAGCYNVYCCYPNPARVPDGQGDLECTPAKMF